MNRTLLVLSLVVFCALPAFSEAYNPRVIDTPDQNDVMPLKDPGVRQTVFGNLEGYPHMFEFATKEPLTLSVEVLVPDIESARDNVSGIVLFVNANGSVREIARLRAREALWQAFYEPWGGDTYRRGSAHITDIEPGTYRIEVSTPDNIGKYALRIGTESKLNLFGYFGLVGRVLEVKAFFGKSQLRIVESPLVYGPILVFVVGIACVWYFRRRARGVPR